MKTNYFYAVFFGMMVLTTTSRSQNILIDGDFSETTRIIPFDTPTPPLNTSAYRVNEYNGAEANPSVVDGVAKIQIPNPGGDYPDVQLTQVGFPLNQGHVYQLSFDVKADSDRYVRIFLGEEGGSATNLIGYDKFWYDVTAGWQTINLEFITTSVFDLHKLSFELGGNGITTYFDNVILQDLGPVPPEKVVIAGTFQSAMGCETDWDPSCENTELTFDSSTDLYSGTFEIPEGNHRYKVTVGGSWDMNYGENGVYYGADIFLCIPAGPEELTFTYNPATHLVTTSPIISGFSPDCLPIVVLSGSFQDELGCSSDGMYDCLNTALIYNPQSGLFEGDFNIPSGCYDYRVVLENNWQNNYGQEGIFNGENYSLYIPSDPEVTHFTYDPVSHIVNSSPYSGNPQEATSVTLEGSSLQNDLILNSDSGFWEGSFILSEGCYTYLIKETFGCNITFYGENGSEGWPEIQLYVPTEAEITFSYDPQTHLITSTPYSGNPQEATAVSIEGSTFQNELLLNSDSGLWEGSFILSQGCHTYRVKETTGCNANYYGENGDYWPEIQLFVPAEAEITFSYDPQTHLISSTPYSGNPEEATSVSLEGSSLQNELILNTDSGFWEGSFILSEGCYTYLIKETFGCNITFYGENGSEGWPEIQLYVPTEAEITFSYDPQTHLITSTPYSGNPQEASAVSIEGSTLQNELILNTDSGYWEGSFSLPAGCYSYWVKESVGCNVSLYGENDQIIQLYIPSEGEITFSYDPESHTMTSTPYNGVPQEFTSVSLHGFPENELGCANDESSECDVPNLVFNPNSGVWEGTFYLPAKCYSYLIKETSACSEKYYGENGNEAAWIQLYVPEETEITFSYDPQTHVVTSTPYYPVPEEVTAVSLVGSFQMEFGCESNEDPGCEKPALMLNPESGYWEGSFTLPAGCHTYLVKETFGCEVNYYGKNGEYGTLIELFLPEDGEITFSYDPQTHTISSTPYSGVPQEVTMVSLLGSLQDELGCESEANPDCDKPALMFNPDSGFWEGSFTLPAGCYWYLVKETFGCNEGILFRENGQESGEPIQLYVPSAGEITFSYDPQTHIIKSTPYGAVPPEMTKVSIIGTLQMEMGCGADYEEECENSALDYNPASGIWEGSFTLPAGCYAYRVKEESVCGVDYYGENGGEIKLYVPTEAEITFSFDPQTHLISSTPYIGVPEGVTSVSLYGSLQNELGCDSDDDQECNNSALIFNSGSGAWEGSFTLPAGCYTYQVKETFGCETNLYGENGEYWPPIELYVPTEAEITFSYDPQTHIITSTPYSGVPLEITAVSLSGIPDDRALQLNADSGFWEASFSLPAGCYYYQVKETSICKETSYGNGYEWNFIQLYIPAESKISFSYDPETHLMTTSPFSGVPEEVTSVALNGYFSDTVSPALTRNEISGNWEGNFELPAGCYMYWAEETISCSNSINYGENGVEAASGGKANQLYIPEGGEVSFSYDPNSHIMTSTPYAGAPQEVTEVSITIYPNELKLRLNPDSGEWEGSFELAAGCYSYEVRETFGCEETSYGGNQFYMPLDGKITFRYDPQTHIVISTPYSGVPEEVTNVNLSGYLDGEYGSIPLRKNETSGKWEGTYMAPAGCYAYRVEETFSCAYNYSYGEDGVENGNFIQLNIPSAGEITFSYDPETHLITSTPYSGAPQEATKVSLYGSFQEEIGCDEFDYECDNSVLSYDPNSDTWTGSFTLPAGCYYYRVKETVGCNMVSEYGKDGVKDGNSVDLYLPTEGEVTLSYDPQTHVITSSPGGIPQDITSVSLFGSLQSEVGCAYDFDLGCDGPALVFNAGSGMWEGSFTIPAGCYTYRVKETFSCESKTYYGKDGTKWSDDIELFVPSETEITFSYDPQTHMITSLPYTDISTVNQCPENIVLESYPGTCGAVVDYPEFVVTEFCGGDVATVTQTEGLPSGSLFPIGTTTNTFELVRTTGEMITCSFEVVVTDTEAPVIADLQENYEPLWPPNHKMVPVFIDYVVSDNCNVTTPVLSVSSNEPQTGRGKGYEAPDWEIVNEHNVLLRAERDPKGIGREYYISIKVIDDAGNFTEEVVTLRVPLNNSKATAGTDFNEQGNDNYVLYPTPAVAVVKIKGPESVSNCTYSIFDMLGVMKLEGTIHEDQVEVGNLPSGTYVIKFRTDEGIISKQFIKK